MGLVMFIKNRHNDFFLYDLIKIDVTIKFKYSI